MSNLVLALKSMCANEILEQFLSGHTFEWVAAYFNIVRKGNAELVHFSQTILNAQVALYWRLRLL